MTKVFSCFAAFGDVDYLNPCEKRHETYIMTNLWMKLTSSRRGVCSPNRAEITFFGASRKLQTIWNNFSVWCYLQGGTSLLSLSHGAASVTMTWSGKSISRATNTNRMITRKLFILLDTNKFFSHYTRSLQAQSQRLMKVDTEQLIFIKSLFDTESNRLWRWLEAEWERAKNTMGNWMKANRGVADDFLKSTRKFESLILTVHSVRWD